MKLTLARQNVSEFFVLWPLADGDLWIALLMKSTLSEIDLGKTKSLRIFDGHVNCNESFPYGDLLQAQKASEFFISVDFEGWCTLLNHASRSVEESIAKCDWLLQDKIFANFRVQGHRLMRMIAWPCQLQWLFPYGDLLLAQKVYEFFIPWNLHVNTCALAMCACNDKSTQSPHKIS